MRFIRLKLKGACLGLFAMLATFSCIENTQQESFREYIRPSRYLLNHWTKSKNILRKAIEGYSNSFDYITVEKIISMQGIFVSDRTTNMQFSRMQNKIYGSLVAIQYHTKCTNPLYPKFTSKKFSVYIFCCNLYLVITYVLILTTDKCSHAIISKCT